MQLGGKGFKKESQTVSFKQKALNICSNLIKYGSLIFLIKKNIYIYINLISYDNVSRCKQNNIV